MCDGCKQVCCICALVWSSIHVSGASGWYKIPATSLISGSHPTVYSTIPAIFMRCATAIGSQPQGQPSGHRSLEITNVTMTRTLNQLQQQETRQPGEPQAVRRGIAYAHAHFQRGVGPPFEVERWKEVLISGCGCSWFVVLFVGGLRFGDL